MGIRRQIWCTPLLAAEWNEDYEERSASWWELFVDLILVVTCSSVAESLEEDLSINGLVAFSVTFTTFVQGWCMYTAFSSRLVDTSLLHSFQLFLYLLATSAMVTNTNGFEYIQQFAMSAALQRCAIIFMYLTTYILLERSRSYLRGVTILSLIPLLLIVASALSASSDSQLFLVLAAAWEGIFALPVGWFIRVRLVPFELLPLNIEHTAERMGCLIMVVLGESIVSALFDYHGRGLDPAKTPQYLTAMTLSLSLTFAFGTIYFAVQPLREDHALRRSAAAGICFHVGHLFLSTALLAVGVGVKLAMHAILAPEALAAGAGPARMEARGAWLLFSATSLAMAAILFLRLAHYGGREPKPSDRPSVKAAKYVWWGAFVVGMVVPLAAGALWIAREEGVDAVQALQLVVGIVGGFALAETLLADLLYQHLLTQCGADHIDASPDHESHPLLPLPDEPPE